MLKTNFAKSPEINLAPNVCQASSGTAKLKSQFILPKTMESTRWNNFATFRKGMKFSEAVSVFQNCSLPNKNFTLQTIEKTFHFSITIGEGACVELFSRNLQDDSLLSSVIVYAHDKIGVEYILNFFLKFNAIDENIVFLGKSLDEVKGSLGEPDYVSSTGIEYVRDQFSVEFLFDIEKKLVCGYISLTWH